MPVDDNLPEVAALLDELAGLVDFTAPGRGGSLGHRLAGVVAGGIADRIAAEVGPDGSPWDANRGTYGERKQALGLPIGVGLRDGGEMASLAQVTGEVRVSPDEVILRYGTDEAARRKAQWFTNGSDGTDGEPSGASNQPPRPFFQLADDDADAVDAEVAAFLDDWLRRS